MKRTTTMNRRFTLFLVCIVISLNNSLATTFHVNPQTGSDAGDGSINMPYLTFENLINNGLIESKSYVTPYDGNNPQKSIRNAGAPIKSGDTIMLYDGLHGDVFIQNYINDDYITVIAAPNQTPILKKLQFMAGSKWHFEGISISSEPYNTYLDDKLVYFESHGWQGPVTHITMKDCIVYSTDNPWTVASEWVSKASDGIYIKGDSLLIDNNQVSNVVMGITIEGNHNDVKNNTIANFAGDGLRILGSNNIIEANIIKNCYKVDDNHDDGIQSFTTGGIVVDSNIVRRNKIYNYEDPNQPLLGDLQGIGGYDGPFRDWTVENNLVVVNHWHGISLYGAIRCSIINNTVLDPTPSVSPGASWILIDDDNAIQAVDCVVKNNVVNSLSINPTSNTDESHNTLLASTTDYGVHFVDYQNYDFQLKETSTLVDAADATVAPSVDIELITRPSGTSPDIGAYEYSYILPVSFGKFDVHMNKREEVILDWETHFEINNAYFEVQRSQTSHSFESIARIQPKGSNSEKLESYNYVDSSPLTGTSYYRILQVDHDGKHQFSKLRSIALFKSDNTIIYPTLLKKGEPFMIRSEENQLELRLFDQLGRLMLQKTVDANTYISLENLSSGLYHYHISHGLIQVQGKLIIQ